MSETETKALAGVDLSNLSGQELKELVEAALDRMSMEELVFFIDAAESRKRLKEDETKGMLLAEFRTRAEKLGLSLESLFPRFPEHATRRTRSDAGVPLTPKFRSPKGETWSGRGIPPRWMSELEAQGHKRDEFRIKEEE